MDIILINVWESLDHRSEAQQFCDVWGLAGDVLLDETAEYTRSLGIRGVPTNVVVDETGVIRAVGVTTPEELHAVISELLGREDW